GLKACTTPAGATVVVQTFRSALYRFNNCSNSLSSADARRREAALLRTAPQLQHEREQQPRTGHPEWMAERDGAAVDVDVVAIETELLLDREILAGERFVDLE